MLANVPAAAAQAVIARTSAATEALQSPEAPVGGVLPVMVTGLLQHEAKLSVVNFSVKKAGSYAPAIVNKEELLLVFGVRSFMARPIWSSDNSGADKHKMQRFLQPGIQAVGSIYAPISYAPQPVLAFKVRALGHRVCIFV